MPAVLLALAGCVTDQEVAEQHQRAEAARLQRRQHEQDVEEYGRKVRTEEWRKFCVAGRQPERSYREEIGCGDFVAQWEENKAPAVGYYRAAVAKAGVLPELCAAADRVVRFSLHPAADLAGVDPSALQSCVSLSEEKARKAEAASFQRAQQQQCSMTCQQAKQGCLNNYESGQAVERSAGHSAGDFGVGAWACRSHYNECMTLCR